MTFPVDPTLLPFFEPRSIVLFGASARPTSLGFGVARNLVQSGYPGTIHFVNPKGGLLMERPLHSSLSSIPDPIDLAILLIPAKFAPQTLAACGQRGIRAAIIASGGFRETDEAGAALEAECLRIAEQYEIRVIGPNCIGLLDTHLPLDTTFLPPPGSTPGDIAFISHSGAICAAIIDWSVGQGFGFSRLVSLGNQSDVSETDMLAPIASDPHTKVVTMYMEGVKNGRSFVQQASQITPEKPIIALKVGRFASGQQAAASHTGALAGSESAFNAAFRRSGVLRAHSSEEQFDWAKALAWCPLPSGRSVAVLTNAGGPGVTAADALEAHGLNLAHLSSDTLAQMQALLPPFASLHNPIDMLASASPTDYAQCLRAVLADEAVHSVMVILPPPPMFSAGAVAKALIPVITTSDKPVVVALMGGRLIPEAAQHFRAAQVPEYPFPERAASALAVLAQRAEFLAQKPQTHVTFADVETDLVHHLLPKDEISRKGTKAQNSLREKSVPFAPSAVTKTYPLPTTIINQMLLAYGIRVPPLELANSAETAVAIVKDLGYPVALKIASPDILHKSDMGGVVLNVTSPQAIAKNFTHLMAKAQAAYPEATVHGVHIQPMIPEGQEVIVGAVQDPQFGPVVMFGSGGVEVEGLQDVAFALAPLTETDAHFLLNNTWAGKKLAGFRNIEAGDKTAVLDTLYRLGQLVADFPEIAEIEINPLRVLKNGVYALDVRATVDASR
ncbi:MAG: acyl-CoA synthetase [Chloroflexi bacterium]|nr:MAG: acyl-CoA synthetase [Chloroflexota bacterium]